MTRLPKFRREREEQISDFILNLLCNVWTALDLKLRIERTLILGITVDNKFLDVFLGWMMMFEVQFYQKKKYIFRPM